MTRSRTIDLDGIDADDLAFPPKKRPRTVDEIQADMSYNPPSSSASDALLANQTTQSQMYADIRAQFIEEEQKRYYKSWCKEAKEAMKEDARLDMEEILKKEREKVKQEKKKHRGLLKIIGILRGQVRELGGVVPEEVEEVVEAGKLGKRKRVEEVVEEVVEKEKEAEVVEEDDDDVFLSMAGDDY